MFYAPLAGFFKLFTWFCFPKNSPRRKYKDQRDETGGILYFDPPYPLHAVSYSPSSVFG